VALSHIHTLYAIERKIKAFSVEKCCCVLQELNVSGLNTLKTWLEVIAGWPSGKGHPGPHRDGLHVEPNSPPWWVAVNEATDKSATY
jgi:hypothetical protein